MEKIRISPFAYIRAMADIAWSAFRYPTKTTIIDLQTGKIIEHIDSTGTISKEDKPGM